jgi:hypothetical protein
VFAGFRQSVERWRHRRKARDYEHGAVAAMVAILLGSGVLLGSGAMVIDVGLLYDEQEQLQTGADAASYKVALNCAKSSVVCTSGAQTTVAVTYAKKNANDGAANAQLCFNGTGCPMWSTNQTCPALPTPPTGTSVGNYVEVRTTTVTSSGSNLIPPVFAQTLPGLSSYQGTQVGACARVNWGPPANVGRVFSMGISLCDWNRMTNPAYGVPTAGFYAPIASLASQVGLYSILGLTSPAAGVDSAIPSVLPAAVLGLPLPDCTTPTINVNLPRGYTWLNSTDGTVADSNCSISVAVGDYPKSTILSGLTVGASNACSARVQAARTSHLPILVPIFDVIQQAVLTLAPAYHIVGFAPFVITGYSSLLGGLVGAVGSLLSGGSLAPTVASTLCSVVSTCVYGYFTKSLVPESHPVFGTGTNYGATIIGRTG